MRRIEVTCSHSVPNVIRVKLQKHKKNVYINKKGKQYDMNISSVNVFQKLRKTILHWSNFVIL